LRLDLLNVDINHIGVQQMPKSNRTFAALFAATLSLVMLMHTVTVPAHAASPVALVELA
jgi:hypothetical protein